MKQRKDIFMNYKQYFSPKIWKRGKEYYEEGLVYDLQKEGNRYNAIVEGTYDYHVEIHLAEDNIDQWYCDCPYAESGNLCKHMAAVIMEIEEKEDAISLVNSIETEPVISIEEMIEQASLDHMKEFLKQELIKDPFLANRFRMFTYPQGQMDVKILLDRLRYIQEYHSNPYGYMDWEETDIYFSDLKEFMDNEVQPLLHTKHYSEAFMISCHIFMGLSEDIDDLNGNISDTCDEILSIWNEIIQNGDDDLKEKVYQWLDDKIDNDLNEELEAYVQTGLITGFREEKFRNRTKKRLLGIIADVKNTRDEWDGYELRKWCMSYLDLLYDSKEFRELEEFIHEYFYLEDVRNIYIKYLLEWKNYEKALSVLDYCIEQNRKYHNSLSQYMIQKKEIYSLMNEKEKYLDILWNLVIEEDIGNIELYQELKSNYSHSEWDIKKRVIYQSWRNDDTLLDLFEMEQDYELLINTVERESGLLYAMKYFKVLKDYDPQRILIKMEHELENQAHSCRNRSDYKALASCLRMMRQARDGDIVVRRIVDRWKKEYSKRPAMQEELKAVWSNSKY